MSPQGPFAVLGIPPTLDPAVVKRAYFRALAQHPPHQDPEGFRALRQAYEELTRQGGLAAAYFQSPVDLLAELAPYRERFDARLHAAAAARQKESERAHLVDRFVESMSRSSFTAALHAFARPAAK